ncbi:MAG: LLM class flavin-dependent oxidoreductase [Actinomycetota bacterium]|nr:MAG: LLM class flavin-dependent oxidoreductase [Actinomycetota bacterium]
MTEPVRFGVIHGFGPFDPEGLVAGAQRAEALGFDLFNVADHLNGDRPTLEPWIALAFVAAATRRLSVVSNVLGLPYRSPAVTAKMAETLDRLSGGRLVLGIGSGGYDAEFSAFGLPERTPGEKVNALDEALHIIRGLWDEPEFTFAGRHYQTHAARIEPKPARRIPIWVGAYGPRALAVTGGLADGWVPSIGRLGLDRLVELRAAVVASLERAGRPVEEFTWATNLVLGPASTSSQDAGRGWRQLTGDSDAVAGQVAQIAAAGFTVINVAFPVADEIERFAAEVIPAVRARLAAA